MTFNLRIVTVSFPSYIVKVLLPALFYFFSCSSFAACHSTSQHEDIQVDKMYIQNGNESLADLLSPADVHKVVTAISKVTCDKSPIYVSVDGETTNYFKFSNTQFTYDSIEDAVGIGALVNKLSVSVLAKGQAPGAQAFDVFISDEKNAAKWDSSSFDVFQLRAEYIITDWTPAICTVKAPSTVTLPSASPGDSVQAPLTIDIECDKTPNTFISGLLTSADSTAKSTDGIIYNDNDIKMTLIDSNTNKPATINFLTDINLSSDNTKLLSYMVHSDIGKEAPSGGYGTNVTFTLYHN